MHSGYDGVSMQQIAEAAHMTKGSPYYHFKGKEDLFAQAFMNRMDTMFHEMMELLQTSTDLRERLIAALTHMLTSADVGVIRLFEDFRRCVGPEYIRKLEEEKRTKSQPDEIRRVYEDLFRDAAASGMHFRHDPERAAIIFLAMQMGSMHTLHMGGLPPMTRDDLATLAVDTVDTFLQGAISPLPPVAD